MLYISLIDSKPEKMVLGPEDKEFSCFGNTKSWEEVGTVEDAILDKFLEYASTRDTFVEMNSISTEESEELEALWEEMDGCNRVKFSTSPLGFKLEIKWSWDKEMFYRVVSEVGHVTWGYVEKF